VETEGVPIPSSNIEEFWPWEEVEGEDTVTSRGIDSAKNEKEIKSKDKEERENEESGKVKEAEERDNREGERREEGKYKVITSEEDKEGERERLVIIEAKIEAKKTVAYERTSTIVKSVSVSFIRLDEREVDGVSYEPVGGEC
jgi:hypothetical protein